MVNKEVEMTIFVRKFITSVIKKSYHNDIKHHMILNTILNVTWVGG